MIPVVKTPVAKVEEVKTPASVIVDKKKAPKPAPVEKVVVEPKKKVAVEEETK